MDGGTEGICSKCADRRQARGVLTPSLVLVLLVYGASSEAGDLVQVSFLHWPFFINFCLHIHPTIVLLVSPFALWVQDSEPEWKVKVPTVPPALWGREAILMFSFFSLLCKVFSALDLLFHFFPRRRLFAPFLSWPWKFPLLPVCCDLLLHPSYFSEQVPQSWLALERGIRSWKHPHVFTALRMSYLSFPLFRVSCLRRHENIQCCQREELFVSVTSLPNTVTWCWWVRRKTPSSLFVCWLLV